MSLHVYIYISLFTLYAINQSKQTDILSEVPLPDPAGDNISEYSVIHQEHHLPRLLGNLKAASRLADADAASLK